jgi:hypothetical protein
MGFAVAPGVVAGAAGRAVREEEAGVGVLGTVENRTKGEIAAASSSGSVSPSSFISAFVVGFLAFLGVTGSGFDCVG